MLAPIEVQIGRAAQSIKLRRAVFLPEHTLVIASAYQHTCRATKRCGVLREKRQRLVYKRGKRIAHDANAAFCDAQAHTVVKNSQYSLN
jgi:hypothetical protein